MTDATESYLHDRVVDGLLISADAAMGMGAGNRKESQADLHARFIGGLRTAENAARSIGHARGIDGQGIAWVRLGTRLGKMLDSSTKAAAETVFMTLNQRPGEGRGKLWMHLGMFLRQMAEDCQKAVQQRSDKPLFILDKEQMN